MMNDSKGRGSNGAAGCRSGSRATLRDSESDSDSECCFVLLIPTPEEYRVPRVNPGVTASKLFPPLP